MPTQADFEQCRTVRHAWDTLSQTLASEYEVGVLCILHFRCTRCTTERFDDIDSYGDLVSRKYVYPDGYQYAEGDTHWTLQDLRLRLMHRAPVVDPAFPPTPDETKTEEKAS